MPGLRGGASSRGWTGDDPPARPEVDEHDARDMTRAGQEILEQRRPDPDRTRSVWEWRWVEGEGYVEVEVGRLPPAGEDA